VFDQNRWQTDNASFLSFSIEFIGPADDQMRRRQKPGRCDDSAASLNPLSANPIINQLITSN
jgi:hypothetical protein